MANAVQMPALSPTMTEGKISRWLKKEGDSVKSGEAIAEVETDKSNLEVEAYDDGVLLQIAVKEGESAPVGAPIAFIGAKGEKVSAQPAAPAPQSPPAQEAKAVVAPRAPQAPVEAPAPDDEPARDAPGRELMYREALNEALSEEMTRDANVFLIGEEVGRYNGAFKVSLGLLDKFGSARVVDAPISELGFTGLSVGAAMVGLRPVVEMMTWNFAILAMDQIVNNAAKLRHMSGGQLRCPIVFRGPGGAGGRLSSQHSQALEANYAHFPGLKVIAPATPRDAKGMLKAAIRDENPVVMFEGEKLYAVKGQVPDGEYTIPLGKADLKREGKDVSIITWSRMYYFCEQAAQELEAEGISVEILDLRTLRPLDEEAILATVKKTNRVVIVEEGWPLAGIGAQVVDIIQSKAFDELDAPIFRVHGLDVNMSYAANLEAATQPDAPKIKAAVKKVMYLEEA
ncbi:MAG: pyruvate dehydrogenase complex E1 component subunit beta [Myxococcota bacterium]|nr:pyruvate dehydrogenase complex E1 component subunit beta [Myxococcota bacterium]